MTKWMLISLKMTVMKIAKIRNSKNNMQESYNGDNVEYPMDNPDQENDQVNEHGIGASNDPK